MPTHEHGDRLSCLLHRRNNLGLKKPKNKTKPGKKLEKRKSGEKETQRKVRNGIGQYQGIHLEHPRGHARHLRACARHAIPPFQGRCVPGRERSGARARTPVGWGKLGGGGGLSVEGGVGGEFSVGRSPVVRFERGGGAVSVRAADVIMRDWPHAQKMRVKSQTSGGPRCKTHAPTRSMRGYPFMEARALTRGKTAPTKY